jgi:hypothetical protein
MVEERRNPDTTQDFSGQEVGYELEGLPSTFVVICGSAL